MRDEFSQAVKRTLALRVNHRCSRCNAPTSGPQSYPSGVLNVGVGAHIIAASPEGPRNDHSLSAEERSSVDNGIWLCQTCAKLIDNDPEIFPVEMLRELKLKAEDRALREIGTAATATTQRYLSISRIRVPLDGGITLASDEEHDCFYVWRTWRDEKRPLYVCQPYTAAGSWKLAEIFKSPPLARCRYVSQDLLISIPYNSNDAIVVTKLETGLERFKILPRAERWISITDACLQGRKLFLGFCGGDVWRVDIDNFSHLQLLPSGQGVQYAYVAYTSDDVIAVSTEEIIKLISTSEVKVLKESSLSDGSSEVCYSRRCHRLVVVGNKYLHVLSPDTLEILDTVALESWGGFSLAVGRESEFAAVIAGLPNGGQNHLQIIDITGGGRHTHIPSAKWESWTSVTMSSTGLFVVACQGDYLQVFRSS